MDQLIIEGGKPLNGTVSANGSKNAGLIMLLACLLTEEKLELSRLPKLCDVETMLNLLRGLGVQVDLNGTIVKLDAKELTSVEAPYDLVRTMRASITCLGPLLAREGKARVSLPGGCAIGTRPVDIHLHALEQMGAELKLEDGYINGSVNGRLKGAIIDLPFPSVGATENIMMAACLAEGETQIRNAAKEPEIIDIAHLLEQMGAKINGVGSSTITINGTAKLSGTKKAIMFDRIEAGTLLLAGPMTGGKVTVTDCIPEYLQSVLDKLRLCGVDVNVQGDSITAQCGEALSPTSIITEPYPGFPTDMQAQLMAFLAQVIGTSEIHELIFENRFMHVPELVRMGANISVSGNKATIIGKPGCYQGATVMATDLRASASLVLAGLAAKGITKVRRIYHLDRGYEHIEDKLSSMGANIKRVKE